jgi:hypothetical protein
MDKEQEIYKYSNPEIVFKTANKFFENPNIKISTRKDKKYMLLNPSNNKWIHFGQWGMEDYTKHHDKKRRMSFLVRNQKWADNDFYTPSFLSYYLLW